MANKTGNARVRVPDPDMIREIIHFFRTIGDERRALDFEEVLVKLENRVELWQRERKTRSTPGTYGRKLQIQEALDILSNGVNGKETSQQ